MAYLALVLDEESRALLEGVAAASAPAGAEVICHHVTLIGPNEYKPGDEPWDVPVAAHCAATHIGGWMGKVAAVAVVDLRYTGSDEIVECRNRLPHVTLWVDRTAGGKPVHSNNVENWDALETGPIPLHGTVQVCN